MTICALVINLGFGLTGFAAPGAGGGATDFAADTGLTPGENGGPIPPPADKPAPAPGGDFTPQSSPLTEATFNVNTGLTLDDGEQPKAYFKDDNNSPLVSFVLTIMNYATAIMGTIGMILLIVAGFMMMFSTGNQQQLDKAKEIVKFAILGLVVAFMSYIIVIFIQSLFVGEPPTTPAA